MKKTILSALFIILIPAISFAQLDVASSHNSKLPVEITSDSLEILQKDQQAIFSGNVEAKQGDIVIKSNEMTVYYNTKHNEISKSQNSVSKVRANGNVQLFTTKETAKSDTGIFDVDKNIITLSGHVSLTNGKNMVKGEQLVYNLTTGQSKIVSSGQGNTTKKERVRGVFMPAN